MKTEFEIITIQAREENRKAKNRPFFYEVIESTDKFFPRGKVVYFYDFLPLFQTEKRVKILPLDNRKGKNIQKAVNNFVGFVTVDLLGEKAFMVLVGNNSPEVDFKNAKKLKPKNKVKFKPDWLDHFLNDGVEINIQPIVKKTIAGYFSQEIRQELKRREIFGNWYHSHFTALQVVSIFLI